MALKKKGYWSPWVPFSCCFLGKDEQWWRIQEWAHTTPQRSRGLPQLEHSESHRIQQCQPQGVAWWWPKWWKEWRQPLQHFLPCFFFFLFFWQGCSRFRDFCWSSENPTNTFYNPVPRRRDYWLFYGLWHIGLWVHPFYTTQILNRTMVILQWWGVIPFSATESCGLPIVLLPQNWKRETIIC